MIAHTTAQPTGKTAAPVTRDWEVTGDGIEHLDTGYFISATVLASRRCDGLWEWPMHMAEKSWCSARPFREAFLAALDLHGIDADDALTRSFAVAAGTRSAASGVAGFVPLSALVKPRSPERKRPIRDDRRAVIRTPGVVRPGASAGSGA